VLRPITVRGAAGVLILVNSRPVTLLTFTVRDRHVSRMSSLTDPDRLARIVPAWAA
jgi:hypothetical protein